MDPLGALEDLFEPRSGPVKTYCELLASGIRHEGGLAMLAEAEAKGLLLWAGRLPNVLN